KNTQHGRFPGAVVAENAQLIAVPDGERDIVERPPHDGPPSAGSAAPQNSSNLSQQRRTKAWLSSVDRELGHDIIERDLGQGTASDALEPIDDAMAKLAHHVNGQSPAQQRSYRDHD